LRRDHVVSSGQLSVVTFTSTYIPLHGVGTDVGFDVVGGCEREGGSECFCERIDTPRHNTIILNKILTPGRYDGVEVGVIVGDDDGEGVSFEVDGDFRSEGGSDGHVRG
jgi:hypothetical protein